MKCHFQSSAKRRCYGRYGAEFVLCACGGMFLANPQTSLSDRRQVSIHRLWVCALKEDYSPLELHANNLLRNGLGKTLLITDPLHLTRQQVD